MKPLVYAAFLFLPALLFAQEALPRIGVIPFETDRSDPVLTGMETAARETVELVLRLIGEYELVTDISDTAAITPFEPAVIAEDADLDTLIYGRAFSADGSYSLELSVFDRRRGETLQSEAGSVESAFDVFDLADRLSIELMSSFSRRRIAFGSLRLRSADDTASVQILLDGVPFSPSPGSEERLLAGEHRLQIFQERLNGRERVFERTVMIEEGESELIDLELPFLTRSEASYFSDLDRQILRNWNLIEGAGEAPAAFTAAIEAANRLRPLPAGAILLSKYNHLLALYGTRTHNISDRNSAGIPPGLRGSFSAPAVPARGIIGEILARRPQLREVPWTAEGIRIDGMADDWDHIETLIVDMRNDFSDRLSFAELRRPANDFRRVAVCRDDRRIYFLFETFDTPDARKTQYRIRIDRENEFAPGFEIGADFRGESRVYVWKTDQETHLFTHIEALERASRTAAGDCIEISLPISVAEEIDGERLIVYNRASGAYEGSVADEVELPSLSFVSTAELLGRKK